MLVSSVTVHLHCPYRTHFVDNMLCEPGVSALVPSEHRWGCHVLPSQENLNDSVFGDTTTFYSTTDPNLCPRWGKILKWDGKELRRSDLKGDFSLGCKCSLPSYEFNC